MTTAIQWIKKISTAKQAHNDYMTTGKECWDRYSGKKDQPLNIFKANTDVLLGALFNEMPKPDIRRRFQETKDEKKDNLYRAVATVADRCVNYNIDTFNAHEELAQVFKDGFVTGRGVGYIEYEFQEEDNQQRVFIKHVPYVNYLEEVCNEEEEISWKARKLPMSKDSVVKEFGVDKEDLGTSLKVEEVEGGQEFVTVWEIWDKKTKSRIYVSPDYSKQKVLRMDKDPLGLEGFFPFISFKTINNGKNTLPTAEFKIYQKLNRELQDITTRKQRLTGNHIKYRPIFDNNAGNDISNSYAAQEGTATPVDGNPSVKIIDMVAAIPTIEAQNITLFLDGRSKSIIEEIWQVTGISDILRGESDSKETATAQKIKGVFGTLRIQQRQEQVQGVVKSLFRMMSESVCEKYMIENLSQISCIQLPSQEERDQALMQVKEVEIFNNLAPVEKEAFAAQGIPVPQITDDIVEVSKQPTIEEVAMVLRSDKLRSYSIDIETTATIFDDIATQREQIQSFTMTLFNMLDKTAQYATQSPSTIDLMEQMTLLNVSQYKVSRSYIDSIKDVFKNIKKEIMEAKTAQENAQPPVDPAIELKKVELQNKQMETQTNAMNDKQKNELEMMKLQTKQEEMRMKSFQEQEKIRLEAEKQAKDFAVDMMLAQDKVDQTDIKRREELRKEYELKMEVAFARQKAAMGDTSDIIAGDVAPIGDM